MTKPAKILISTANRLRLEGLRRVDVVGGMNYAEAVIACGGLPMFLPNADPKLASAYLQEADGLILSGGADFDPALFNEQPHPELGIVDAERDAFELELYHSAKQLGMPVLGICRGIQAINVAEGGTLHQHVPAVAGSIQHGQRNIDGTPFHNVTLDDSSRLAQAHGTTSIRVNSYHHQAVDRLGRNLRITGRAADGIIEAIEGTSDVFVLGVQWHPEMSFARYPEHLTVFKLLMEAVAEKQAQRLPKLVEA